MEGKSYRDVKTVDLKNGWGIDCITAYNAYTGVKVYSIEVCMECVPWRDIVERYSGFSTPEEANEKYKELRKKYLDMPVGFL